MGPRLTARRTISGRRAAVLTMSVGGAAALSWWMAVHPRQSTSSHVAVTAVSAFALAAALVQGQGRQRAPSRRWLSATSSRIRTDPWFAAGAAGWVLVVGAIVSWDLVSFAAQSAALPTLSRLIGHLSAHREGRGILFGLWLAAGGALALAGRRRTVRTDHARRRARTDRLSAAVSRDTGAEPAFPGAAPRQPGQE